MKKLLYRIAGVVSLLSAPLFISTAVRAAADTCTWTGGGADNNFTTAANWSGCDNGTVPEAGDTLDFPANIASDAATPNNDMTAGTSFEQIIFSGTPATADGQTSSYDIDGNAIELVGGIDITMTGVQSQDILLDVTFTATQILNSGTGYLNLGVVNVGTYTITADGAGVTFGDISGSGNITFQGYSGSLLGTASTFTGTMTVSADTYLQARRPLAIGTGAVVITVTNNGSVILCGNSSGTTVYNQSFTLAGDGPTGAYDSSEQGAINATKFCGGGAGGAYVPANTEISGTVTLTANTVVKLADNLKITGPLSGAFTITAQAGGTGQLVIASSNNASQTPNGTQDVQIITTTLADALPTAQLNIPQNSVIIVTGSRGDVFVTGTLKGTGTVGNVATNPGGTVAPGLSPGCLNTGNLDLTDGTLQVELEDLTACTEYDQTRVTGTVTLASSTLQIVRFNGMVPRLNNSFTIISNDGTDAVSGTFTGLAQGATVVADGVTYTISYTGGDGNDVVLTVTAVDSSLGAPNTGVLRLIRSGAILPLLAIAAAASIFGLNYAVEKRKK